MIPYISGFSHAVLILCLVFICLENPMDKTGKFSEALAPYTLVIEDDCYIPNPAGGSFEALPISATAVEHHFEGRAP